MREMADTLRSTFQRVFRLENRRRAPRAGRLEKIHAFESKILGNTREITIYLPPGYADRPEARYPVLYMQDGQNLFEPERSFIPGRHWRLLEAADAAIADRAARAMIIVGIDNAGGDRIDEYTPTHDEVKHHGGRADDYGRMLVEELKPIIDAGYRTMTDKANTAIGGSSLGGLVSLYLGLKRPDVFGGVASMSPSVWWDSRMIVGMLDRFDSKERPRVWLDIGGREGTEALNDARVLRERMTAMGWNEGSFRYFEDRRADHSEGAWAKRVRTVLEFLFPPA
jgi:predicted alpha/beta superfamily hydrolase